MARAVLAFKGIKLIAKFILCVVIKMKYVKIR